MVMYMGWTGKKNSERPSESLENLVKHPLPRMSCSLEAKFKETRGGSEQKQYIVVQMFQNPS